MWWNAFGACPDMPRAKCSTCAAAGIAVSFSRKTFPWRLKSVVTTKLLITYHIPIPARGR